MNSNNKSVRLLAVVMLAAASITSLADASAATNLADQPLFTSTGVAGNMALTPSVEFPTAISVANIGNYSPSSEYLGYFDPKKCYTYQHDATPANSYFVPAGAATNHACTGKWAATSSTGLRCRPSTRSMGADRLSRSGRTRPTVLERPGARRSAATTSSRIAARTAAAATTDDRLDPALIPTVTPQLVRFNLRMWGCGSKMVFTGGNSVSNCTGTNQVDATVATNSMCACRSAYREAWSRTAAHGSISAGA
jgi:type IV pilus assembly protein PilY1